MATYEQAIQALKAADKAGNIDDAKQLAKIARSLKPEEKDYKSLYQEGDYKPTDDMNMLEKGLAGVGKSASDMWKGTKQLLNIGDQEELQAEIDNTKERDQDLMDTGSGITGNILGHVGMSLLPGGALMRGANAASKVPAIAKSAPAIEKLAQTILTPKRVLSGAGVGAGYSSFMPTASDESVGTQLALGAGGGALFPSLAALFRGTKSLSEPFYEAGRKNIVGRTIKRAAGDNYDDVMKRMGEAKEIVPNSKPTAADVAESPGISRIQKQMSGMTDDIRMREIDQNSARVDELANLIGGASETGLKQARKKVTQPLYQAAQQSDAIVDPSRTASLIDRIINKNPARKQLVDSLTSVRESLAESFPVDHAIVTGKQ